MIPEDKLELTRRAFATGMTGSLAVLGIADPGAASERQDALVRSDLRDAALRGLARAGDCGDPVLAAKADTILAQLETGDPEGSLLVQIYRAFDVESAASRYGRVQDDDATAPHLAALHAAIHDRQAVSFRYTDQMGDVTARTVLPLALVHPPQGIKLLAWCKKRQDFRQFFVRSMRALKPSATHFGDRRMELLQELVSSLA